MSTASPRRPRAPGAPRIYLFALIATALMVLLRWVLDPILGDHLPLVTLFSAVAIAVWLGGYRPALTAAVLGYLACDYLFIDPRGTIGALSVRNSVGLLAYLVTCLIIIALGEAMRSQHRAASEERDKLKVTLASIGDAVITTDPKGHITYLNAVAESLTGWSRSEALGRPLDSVFRILNERSRAVVESPATRALREGLVVGLANHTVLIGKDGSERPIDDSAAPIRDEEGGVRGCVLVFRDIAERRRLERGIADRLASARLLASIVESSHDAIVSKNLDGVIQTWNASAEKLFGWRADEAIGRHISLIIPDDRASEEDLILQRIREGKTVNHFETVRVRSDRQSVDVSVTISPIKDEEGRVIGASKIVRDISEKKESEARISALMAELQRTDRQKDEFLATIAHELRNPLAPIQNAVQILLRKGPPDPTLVWSRGLIDRQVKQMARLLDDLLDMSRVSHNKLELRREAVDLSRVIEDAVETSRPLIDAAGLTLSISLPAEPVVLDADPVRLGQVFANLLNNSAKYTEPGGRIVLSARRDDESVSVSVADDGIGIDAESLPRVFDLFEQSNAGLKRSGGGLGIGLSLVKGIVDLHGGVVKAESGGPGRGSTFTVSLPAMRDAGRRGPVADHEPSSVSTAKRRFLVVDDIRDNADSLATLLRVMGHEAEVAYDGEEAVAAAGRLRPDVVLLDIGMPAVDGYEACRRIRRQPWGRDMCLIAMTGWGKDEDKRRAAEAGFDQHMVKPIDPIGLLNRLDERTGRGELR